MERFLRCNQSKYTSCCYGNPQNPNASQWNIGSVGSPTQNFRIGHVHFMFFVLISFALVTQPWKTMYQRDVDNKLN